MYNISKFINNFSCDTSHAGCTLYINGNQIFNGSLFEMAYYVDEFYNGECYNLLLSKYRMIIYTRDIIKRYIKNMKPVVIFNIIGRHIHLKHRIYLKVLHENDYYDIYYDAVDTVRNCTPHGYVAYYHHNIYPI